MRQPQQIEIDDDDIASGVAKLSRDLVRASNVMTDQEARYLVDSYYMMQESRKRLTNQVRAMAGEPHQVIAWQQRQMIVLETQIKRSLDVYTDGRLIGRWCKAHYGIGPCLTAGLLAHIDINKAVVVGSIWRFGGVDPNITWEKKHKRPWNADLKVIFWLIGQSFMKFSGKDECVYGGVYRRRKEYEIKRNNAGGNAARCTEILQKKNYNKATEAYKHYSKGLLPPAHIDAQARRYAVKLFLGHMHFVWRFIETKQLPEDPYGIGPMDHTNFIMPQNINMIEGLMDAMSDAGLITRSPA